MRVLVGGVGYRNLRDHSFGVAVVDTLGTRPWPDDVAVEDVSYNPIALVQRLEDERHRPFDRAVIVGAARRAGREPGTLHVYRWDNALPDPDHVQAAVAQAVTGVIALDNTLVIGRYFGALPAEVVVIEVEPLEEAFGEAFSPAVAAVFDRASATATMFALEEDAAARVAAAPLGGGWPRVIDEAGGKPGGIVRFW